MVDISSGPTAGLQRWVPHLGFSGLVASLITLAFACGDIGDRFPPPSPYTGTGGGYTPPLPHPCSDGDTRDCHVVLGQQGNILSCYDGTQTCVAGVWGECVDGTVRVSPAPPELPHPLTFTDAGGCGNNPCDPTCQSFGVDAGPDGGSLAIPVNPGGATWQTGDLSTLASAPGGLVNKGILANCTSAFDCQFDFKCTNPAISNCTHSKCATGGALTVGCDPPASTGTPGCVAEICAANKDPACCKTPLSLTGCSKSPCSVQTGGITGCLDLTIAGAITSVVGGNASCLTNWTQACVDAYRKIPGVGCGWDAQCVKEVGTTCGITCDQDNGSGVCVQRLANEKDPNCPGVDLTAGIPCDGGIPICNHGQSNLPSQPIRIWLYPANSGHIPAGSPTGSPDPTECIVTKAIPAGKCVNVTTAECSFNGTSKEIIVNPQNAGLTNPAPIAECTTKNNWTLYSGSGACGAAICAGNAVPTTTVPVNMFVMFDRSGSMNQVPSGQTLTKLQTAKNALTTFFSDPKAAGTKIYFRTFPDTDGDPASGTKCQDTNNCQLTGEINACSIAQITGTLPDTNLVNYVNAITTESGTPSYVSLSGALKAAKDYKATHPTEAVAVVYVTDGAPSNGGCTTKAKDARDAVTTAYSAGVSTYVIGMAGAEYEYLDPLAAAGVGHIACDASNPCPSPGTCSGCNKQGQTCSIDADCCDGYGSCSSSKCQSGALTSTCTGLAINADTSSSATIATKLLSIKTKLTSCTLGISACKGSGAACGSNADCCSNTCTGGLCAGGQAGFSTTGASLIYTSGIGDSTAEPYRTSSTGCNGTANDGWYFDNPTAPAQVTLCPKTCSTVQADANPQVNLTLPCPPPYSNTVLTLQYEANCPSGTNPQWAFLAYDTTTPLDATIELYGQYAGATTGLCTINTLADITACTALSKLAVPSVKGGTQACTTANAATNCPSKTCGTNGLCTDPQVCQTTPTYPGCPVDLFQKMNTTVGAAARYFQLVIKLNASAGGLQTPVVNNIGLTYSCPPSD